VTICLDYNTSKYVFVAVSVAQSRIHIYVFAVLTATKCSETFSFQEMLNEVRVTNLTTTRKLRRKLLRPGRRGEAGVGEFDLNTGSVSWAKLKETTSSLNSDTY